MNILAADSYTPPANGIGKWGPTIDFPVVPVAAAVIPTTGKVLVWSSYAPDTFDGGPGGMTTTATYDPSTGTVSQQTVTNTQHDMFCPGISMDLNGRPVVTGGNNAEKTSIFNPSSNAWIPGGNMVTPRGYQSSAALSNGQIFIIGGSWNGGRGNKNGEVFNPATSTWAALPGCPVAPIITGDVQGVFRADNHAWLFGWKGGSVFQVRSQFTQVIFVAKAYTSQQHLSRFVNLLNLLKGVKPVGPVRSVDRFDVLMTVFPL